MPNPNNNKHFNDEALRINRELKKENDKLKKQLKDAESLVCSYCGIGHFKEEVSND